MHTNAHVAEQAISFEVTEKDVWGHGKLPPKNAASMWWPTTFQILKGEKVLWQLLSDWNLGRRNGNSGCRTTWQGICWRRILYADGRCWMRGRARDMARRF